MENGPDENGPDENGQDENGPDENERTLPLNRLAPTQQLSLAGIWLRSSVVHPDISCHQGRHWTA